MASPNYVKKMQPITIQATIKKDVKTVWNALNDPQHIVNWNFAIDTWHCPSASNDLRPGGKLTATMAAKDGSFSFDFSGTYSEIRPHEFIHYVLDDGRHVKVRFEVNGEQVKVTQTFEPEAVNPVDMQQSGWQAILNNFAKYAEAL